MLLRILLVVAVGFVLLQLNLQARPLLVEVGDVGNKGKVIPFTKNDISRDYPRGGVDYPYRIAVGEVTNEEYAEFLNKCAQGEDMLGLYQKGMDIVRSRQGDWWQYTPVEGKKDLPVVHVSRINAARYCNFLTTGNPSLGAYNIASRIQENGQVTEVIVGFRDLTFPDAPVVYFLPNMHEFYKAGWYEGDGQYRHLTTNKLYEPSRFGIQGQASGVREWMDNKYYGAVPFALGADSGSTDEDSLNTVKYFPQKSGEGNAKTGFRVAATASLQIGDRLNNKQNFFTNDTDVALLRIRHDGPPTIIDFFLELRDFRNDLVWERTLPISLSSGVSVLPVELPEEDGYYELTVTPAMDLWEEHGTTIPLVIMRAQMPDFGPNGNFGFTIHITRQERRFTYEKIDFEFLRTLGVSQVRVDVHHDDTDGSQEALFRIHRAGLNPVAIITNKGIRSFGEIQESMKANPEIVAKWAPKGVSAEFACYAENVYQLVRKFKGIVQCWEFGNEPTYWEIFAEDYAQALKAGYIAAKLANSDALVIAGDLNAIHAPVLQLGTGPYFDAVATHIYGFYVPMFWGIAGKMRELNGWMAAADLKERPLWITEIGGATYSSRHMIPVRDLDEVQRYHALHQPKVMAGGLAFGASKVLPYNYRATPLDFYEEEFGMLDREGMPRSAIASYRTTARLLGNATFIGFIKGHSMESGKIAGLLFRDAEGRDVCVAWRNDVYGYGHFERPFFDIISSPQTITLPASGRSVELTNMVGGSSKIPVKSGMIKVPVDEYPVFVRGKLSPEIANIETAHPIAKFTVPNVRVRVRPNKETKASDLMSGPVLDLVENQQESVEVSVYNTQNKPLRGTVRLIPRRSWREWEWPVIPESTTLDVLPNGMATARFKIEVPEHKNSSSVFYLDAIFNTLDGQEYRDTVAFHIVKRQMPVSDWISYTKGTELNSNSNATEIIIGVPATESGYVSFYRRTPSQITFTSEELEEDVVISVEPQDINITAASLLFQDTNGETFQIKQPIQASVNEWSTVRFHMKDILSKNVIIHRGGDTQLDFPLRLLGFNFDFHDAGNDASISIRNFRFTKPLNLWKLGAWKVYGEGFRILGLSDDDLYLNIEREKNGRSYATLVPTTQQVVAKDTNDWPKEIEIGFLTKGIAMTSISLLLKDASGEIFQFKKTSNASGDGSGSMTFTLDSFVENKGLIIYGGDGNKQIEYPVSLFGYNFDFPQMDAELQFSITPPQIDPSNTEQEPQTKDVKSTGGGAVNMN